MKILNICLLLFAISAGAASVGAASVGDASVGDDFRWSIKGFGTLGFTGTDSNDIGFKRTATQTIDATKSWGTATDSRLGLQVDVDFNQSLHATVQWIARDHSGNFFEQNLDWAFLRWNINDTSNIRLGRLGVDVFLLSDYRDVGYAYPWIRPPHEFYSQILFNHFDGFDFTHRISDQVSIKLFAGRSLNVIPVDIDPEFKLINGVAGASIKYESDSWTTRAGYAYVRLLNDDDALDEAITLVNDPLANFGIPGLSQLSSVIAIKDSEVHYYTLGAAYDDGTWLAQAEVSYSDTDTIYFPDTISSYLSIGRRFSNITLYSLYGISHSKKNNVDIPSPIFPLPALQQLEQGLEALLNTHGVDQQSISLGLRWDFYQNVAFKAQWSHFWLGEQGTQYWYADPFSDSQSEQINVWSFGVDFVF